MAQVPLPKKGCFQASYPSKAWHEVACTTAPNYPMTPGRDAQPGGAANNQKPAPGVLYARADAQQTTPSSAPNEKLSPDELRIREDWRISMAQVPLPRKGCFQSTYPNRDWREVACMATPNYPMPPRRGARALVVGNSNDVAAQSPVATDFISTGIGSFSSVTGVTSESGPIGNTGPSIANAYTLQLNTNFFKSTVCAGSPNPNCQGWQQFVYENFGTGGRAFIQYWLIQYNTTCPAGQSWNQFSFTGSTDIYCWKNNSLGAVPVPNQPITNLANLSLSGAVSSTGDSVTVSTGGSTMYARAGDNAVNAAAGWQTAEFNLFGDGGNSSGGGQASFNSGSSVVPRTRIIYGGTAAPNCIAQGFTAETNNLSFGPTAPTASAPGPALLFTESSAGGAPSDCAAATGVGDTHLKTFGGLFYDFQASGDFVLAQADQDFVVETRQVSGAPTWPNATVNHAVATRMGKTQVAVCLAPARLNVDGENIELDNGQSHSTSGGVDIWRTGNAYTITDSGGNSVHAVVNPTWIDVTVGLGRWPANVTGLLANAEGNVNKIAARDGTVLTNPFSFEDLYHRFGDSWRVPADDSLLSACGQRSVEFGTPRKTFYAKDLDRTVYERTRSVCTAAGVKAGPLLDACTLDVAVIGNDSASLVFVNAPEPNAVGSIVNPPGSGRLKWLLWLIVLLILLWILLVLLRRKKP
ncbi:MAG TPA: VWD domain-containing protein [Terracidiphilus sp.]